MRREIGVGDASHRYVPVNNFIHGTRSMPLLISNHGDSQLIETAEQCVSDR
jgi:hypothetical protein